jgi:hypothetical protein
MVVTIKKGSNKEEVLEAISKISKEENKKGLLDFFGTLKNSFGDGLEYQKKIRNEWD